jgi:hypothetical protein
VKDIFAFAEYTDTTSVFPRVAPSVNITESSALTGASKAR